MKLASLCYLKKDGKTLMLHRVKKLNDIHQGKWNGLGGKFEPGETPEECAIREIREESGLIVDEIILKGILTFPLFSKEEDWYVFVFVSHKFHGEMICSNEGNLAWIDDSQLLSLPLWPGDRIFLPWITRPEFFSGKFTYIDGELHSHDVKFYGID